MLGDIGDILGLPSPYFFLDIVRSSLVLMLK